VYALNFGSKTLERLNQPSGVDSFVTVFDADKVIEMCTPFWEADPPIACRADTCENSLPDGTPTSRHTFGHAAYITHLDKYFFYGGSQGCGSGGFGTDVWLFDLNTLTWEKQGNFAIIGSKGVQSVYDPVSQDVLLISPQGYFRYEIATKTMTRLFRRSIGDVRVDFGYAVMEPQQRIIVFVYHLGVFIFPMDIEKGTEDLSLKIETTGPQDMMAVRRGPGMTWHPGRRTFVLWDPSDGGINPESVYELNPRTWQWIKYTAPGPITSTGASGGIYGRWQYVPSVGGIVGVPCAKCNAVVWRFDGTEPPPDTEPPVAPTGLEVE